MASWEPQADGEFDRQARRARIRQASQHFAADVDREEHVEAIAAAVEGPPFGAHTGWWRDHKHPRDQAAEIEEEWRFAHAKPRTTKGAAA